MNMIDFENIMAIVERYNEDYTITAQISNDLKNLITPEEEN